VGHGRMAERLKVGSIACVDPQEGARWRLPVSWARLCQQSSLAKLARFKEHLHRLGSLAQRHQDLCRLGSRKQSQKRESSTDGQGSAIDCLGLATGGGQMVHPSMEDECCLSVGEHHLGKPSRISPALTFLEVVAGLGTTAHQGQQLHAILKPPACQHVARHLHHL